MKKRDKSQGHPSPEFTIDELQEVFLQQRGVCFRSDETLKIKRGDGDPYNFSPAKLDNSLPYKKGNLVFICQWLQIGHGYDVKAGEVKSWLNYKSENDGFVFDETIFSKPNFYQYNGKIQKRFDDNGVIISKTCPKCNKMLSLTTFMGNHYICRFCEVDSPYAIVKNMGRYAKKHAKKRRRDDGDFFDLFVNKIKHQGGRCDLTRVPFVYEKNHKFMPSYYLHDPSLGITESNVSIIIAPLNTGTKIPIEMWNRTK
jgi:hypothetical protein